MSPLQQNLYWRRWSACKRALAKLGRPTDDAARHALHRQALGVDKSSTKFTNADFDKVLAVFAALSAPADLQQQLRAQEQPAKRLGKLRADCWSIVRQLPRIVADQDPTYAAERYLDSLARSVSGKRYDELDERDTARVLGILRHRLGPVPPAAELPDEKVPF